MNVIEIINGDKKRNNSQYQAKTFNNFLLMEESLLYMYFAGSSHLLITSIFNACLNTNFLHWICWYYI